jgi:hypothetical protein
VRVSREDERVDSQVRIGKQSRSHRVGIAYQCGSRSTTNQADAGPQVWADFQPIASSAVERRHPPLTFRLELSERVLCGRDGGIVQMRDEVVRGIPGLNLGVADDDVDA